MSQTFACPHCTAIYPRKPVLVGRTVRCTTCRNAFRLRADGVADKVGAGEAASDGSTVSRADTTRPAATAQAAPSSQPPSTTPPQAAARPSTTRPALAPPPPPIIRPQAAAPSPTAPASDKARAVPPAASASPATSSAPAPRQPAAPASLPVEASITLPDSPVMRPAIDPIDVEEPRQHQLKPPSTPDPDLAGTVKTAPISTRLATAKPSIGGAAGSPAIRPASVRMSAVQVDAKRTMASTLSSAMDQALDADAARQQAEAGEAARRKRQDRPEGGTSRLRPAVLTGEGEREQRNARRWQISALVAAALIAGMAWLLTRPSPEAAALADFTRPVPAEENVPGRRIPAIQQRAWLSARVRGGAGVSPFVDLSDAEFASAVTVPFANLGAALAPLQGMVLIDEAGVWATASQEAAVRRLWLDKPDPAALLAGADGKALKIVPVADVHGRLSSAGIDDTAKAIVIGLLHGQTGTGGNDIAARLLAGEQPVSFDYLPFRGRSGRLLKVNGRTYGGEDLPYEGLLLRFNGPGWPSGWRMFDLRPVGRD